MLRRSLLVILVLSCLAAPASAVEFNAFLDLDGDPSTGCSVSTVDGAFDGVEEVVITTVTGGQIVSVERRTCDTGTLTLDPPALLADFPTPWNVGVGNGVDGTDAVETYFPLPAPLPDPLSIRLGFDAGDGTTSQDALLTVNGAPGGGPILITTGTVLDVPTLSTVALALLSLMLTLAAWQILRQRPSAGAWLVLLVAGSLLTGSVLAVGMIVLDGATADWSGAADASANDPFNDGPPSADLRAGFAALDTTGTYLYLRFDVAAAPVAVAVDDTGTVLEDAAATAVDVLGNESNPGALPLSITAITTQPTNGTVLITGGGTGLTYQPDADTCNNGSPTDNFVYELNGMTTATVAMTVTCVNDEPAFTAGADPTVAEDAGAQSLAGWATGLTDSDAEAVQTLSFNLSNDNNALFAVQPAVDAAGTLTFTSAPDAFGSANVDVTLTDDGGTANGGDDTSPTQSFTITVTPVNDPPTHTGTAGVTAFTEGAGAVVVDAGIVLADVDSANLVSATVTVNVLNAGQETLAASTGGTSIVANYTPATGVLNLTGSDTVANYQTVLRSVTYNNASGTPNTADRTVSCVVNDGLADSLTAAKTISLTAVNSPPTVTSSTIDYVTVGNTLLRVDSGDADGHDTTLPGRVASTIDLMDAFMKSGAADADGPSLGFTPKLAEATDQGGSITLDDDGDFFYLPPIGFTGVDTETLVLTDSISSVNVTLRITVSDMVWYVEDTIHPKNPAGNTDGRSTDAFQTLAAAAAAAGAGHTILLFETDAPLDETISLKTGQKLYGQRVEEESVSLLPTGLLLEEVADTNARPQVHRTSGPAVTVDSTAGALANVEIRHLDLQSGDDDAITITTAGSNLVSTLLIDENVIGGAGAHGIDLNATHTTGEATVEIRDNQITSAANAVDVVSSGAGALALAINGNLNLTSTGGRGLNVVESAGTVTVTSLNGNSVHGDTGGHGMYFEGVTFDADTATAAYEQVDANNTAIGAAANAVGGSGLVLAGASGDLLFDDLDIEAAGAGIDATGSGVVNTGAGTGFRLTTGTGSTVNALGGPALDLDPMTVAGTFASLSSASSPTQGLFLHDVEGTITASTGSITGSAGHAVFVDQDTVTGALNLTYGGTVTNTAGNLIRVEGLPAGTLTFNGTSMSDSGAGGNTGTGIHLADVDGTINVSATSTTLTQSDATAINIAGDSDGTINFDNVTITSPASTAIQIVDGTDRLGGIFDFDNVDVTFATNAQRLLDIQGLNTGGSVSFDAASTLAATDGTGINISSNTGNGSVTLSGPVDLGTSGSRLSDGQAFTMASNGPGNVITIPDLDVFTSGQTAVGASGAGTLDINALSVNTASNGRGLDLTGIVSAVDVDSMTCSHSSACVNVTSLAAGSSTTFAGLALTCSDGSCFNANLAQTVEVTGSGNQVTCPRTAVSLVNTAIGPNHATFQSLNVNGGGASTVPAVVLTGTGAGNFHVTGTGAAGTGGTLENILLDAVRLSNTAGSVTFEDMIIEDIGNMAGASDTGSGHDAVHAESVLGGLTLDNVTIRRISDSAIHGTTLAGGASTVFDGLQILNSTIEDTNRYHVADTADDNNEAMVRIRGIKGTVNVIGSTLQRGAELLDLNTDVAGTLTMTVQNNIFNDSFKGLAASASAAGLACINVKMVQAADSVIHIGDPAETNAALGNTFGDCATAAVALKHLDENATGDITAIISRNVFNNDISFGGVGGNPFGFGNVPSTGILLRPQGTSTADLNAIVSHNTLTNQGLVEGQIGAISVQLDSAGGVTSGTSQVRVSDNTINTPIGGPIFVQAERNTAARVLLQNNTFTAGIVSQPDFGPSSHPGNSTQVRTREGGKLEVTIENHFFPAQDDMFVEIGESFKALTLGGAPGTDSLCLSFACPSCGGGVHATSDLGYQLNHTAGTTFLLHRGASASSVPQTILQDNGVRGGTSNPALNPPTVGVFGTITPTDIACAKPSGGIFP